MLNRVFVYTDMGSKAFPFASISLQILLLFDFEDDASSLLVGLPVQYTLFYVGFKRVL